MLTQMETSSKKFLHYNNPEIKVFWFKGHKVTSKKQEAGDDVCVLNLEFVNLKVAWPEIFSHNASL